MAVSSADELLGVLRSGNDEEIEGTEESVWCEFKSQPYNLSNVADQWELAKDVAAMANSEGGVILVAVETHRPEDRDEEVAQSVRPFPRSMVDRKRVQDVLRERTYPPLSERVRCEIHERGADKCLVSIAVPEATDDDQPVLVSRNYTEEGKTVPTFGVPRRVGAHTEWAPIGQLHRDMSDGRRTRRQPFDAPQEQVPEPTRGADDRLDQIEDYLEWSRDSLLYLMAVPPSGASVIESFYVARGGMFEVLSGLGRYGLRDTGFGLGYGIDVDIVGESLVTADKDRVVWLEPSGFLTCASIGSSEFLGWAEEQFPAVHVGDRRATRINRVVVTEYVFEFARFVEAELLSRVGGNWEGIVGGRRMQSGHSPMAMPDRDHDVFAQTRGAVLDDWSQTVPLSGDHEVDAFQLLSCVFGRFQLPAEAIPLVQDGRIRDDVIRNIGNTQPT